MGLCLTTVLLKMFGCLTMNQSLIERGKYQCSINLVFEHASGHASFNSFMYDICFNLNGSRRWTKSTAQSEHVLLKTREYASVLTMLIPVGSKVQTMLQFEVFISFS